MEKIKTIFSSNTEDQNETTGIVDDVCVLIHFISLKYLYI